ncbi:MAG: bacteriohemerythrin [Rhodospirillaceae bacterium]
MSTSLPLLIWTESLMIGVDAIDAEHQALLTLINDSLRCGETPFGAEEGAAMIDRLLGLAIEHFCHEEEVMVRIGYPDFHRHRRAHIKLREQARFLKRALAEEGGAAISHAELAGFLSGWLIDHLAGMDMLLRPHIARHVALNGPL